MLGDRVLCGEAGVCGWGRMRVFQCISAAAGLRCLRVSLPMGGVR